MAIGESSLAQPPSPSLGEFSAPNPGALLQLTEDLHALVLAGLIYPFEDSEGVVRYRPVGR